ncbi:transketolase [Holospora elegans E1]|uniref:transketolase n=1 Tax=Holospora elegans E1 TaxID=1427503 RepID=A0A023DXK6_9PROT|nr:transketolase [Holospora elegans]GAJ46146.1 transketolase [Holospora elegans E1]
MNAFKAPVNFFPLAANALRILAMDSVEHAGSGHPGMAMGMADVMAVLASQYLKWDPCDTQWPDRDRFVLSAGHGAPLWYAALYMWGVLSLEDLKNYRKHASKTPGHPERGTPLGTEVTTGPLGQGLANALGMALSESLLRKEFTQTLVDHYTYVILGDGCLMEGVAQEAISLAGHWRLHRLIVFWDDNKVTIDGPVDLSGSDDIVQRFKASGWNTLCINGHDFNAISNAIDIAKKSCQPTLIGCRTHIGYGSPNKMGTCQAHGSPLGYQEAQAVRKALAWPWNEAFFVPEFLLKQWKHFSQKSTTSHKAWQERFSTQDSSMQDRFSKAINGAALSQKAQEQLRAKGIFYAQERPAISTRSASGAVLAQIFPYTRLLAGAADLKDSTCTDPKEWTPYRPFLYYGIREHAMAAIMNGISAHAGFIPCGGTFLAFSDYMRPALRLSALMGIKVIYIMTHDSIGLGEDGPTHQPIEQLISLRAIPNLTVLRPGDSVEVVECWEIALQEKGPVILCLSRQSLPTFSKVYKEENLCKAGAYPLLPATKTPKVNLWASGSEVHLALTIAHELADQHSVSAQVYSVPWMMRWLQRYPEPWKCFPSDLQISIEASSPLGWYQVTGPGGINIGMETFGASGESSVLFKHFGFSSTAIVQKILDTL